ncbi:hypothetical protein N9J08_00695 [Hellea sp.]|nr:hypothetical protein [Hellea sp.]MDA8996844.1 hypothetical protein [Hellea sp.]
MPPKAASSGHKIGQIIGDWWEEHVIFPLLADVALKLDLFLDCRFVERSVRPGSKVLWKDDDGNQVDYDFVLEIGGDDKEIGVPVAFIESFWRRGSRHSKDKARDDTNKLLPMRATYPTARFLSIAASGEFTGPASEYIRTRGVDLFFIPKQKILTAFQEHDLIVDYPDQLPEADKSKLAENLISVFDSRMAQEVSATLNKVCGKAMMSGYANRIIAALSALPVGIEISQAQVSEVVSFQTIHEVDKFFKNPQFEYSSDEYTYRYVVNYSDGSEFETDYLEMKQILDIHNMTKRYVKHIANLIVA